MFLMHRTARAAALSAAAFAAVLAASGPAFAWPARKSEAVDVQRETPRPKRYYRYMDQPDRYYAEDGTIAFAGDTPIAFEPPSPSARETVGAAFDPYVAAGGNRTSRVFGVAATSGYVIQVGAFSNLANAERVRDQVDAAGPARVAQTSSGLHRVQVGPYASRADAERGRAALARLGFPTVMVARAG